MGYSFSSGPGTLDGLLRGPGRLPKAAPTSPHKAAILGVELAMQSQLRVGDHAENTVREVAMSGRGRWEQEWVC